jgi:long-chain acyl-CoA synthetase
VSNELINKLISVDIDKMSIDLAPFEHIGRFTLLDREFSIDSGELTATLKIRRKAINTIYKDQIDSMY